MRTGAGGAERGWGAVKTVKTTAGPVKCRLYDLDGKRATLLRHVANHYARVAQGSPVTVMAYGKYVSIESDKCPCCKVQIRVTRIPLEDLLFEPFEHDPKLGEKFRRRRR